MKHLIIYAHPNPKSFNHAILETVEQTLTEKGHEIKVVDLYAQNFNCVLASNDFVSFSKGEVPADIKAEQEKITWADSLIFIYPVWWTAMPSMMKGYVDRVFAMGFAYGYSATGLEKKLTGKKGMLISTTGSPSDAYEASGMYNAMKATTDSGIFDFTGIEPLGHVFFGAVPSVDDETRKGYLEQVKQKVNSVYGN